MILTVDPGLRGCGCAAWTSTGELLRAAYVPGEANVSESLADTVEATVAAVGRWGADAPEVDKLVIEYPQTYRGRSARGDANDLIAVALVVGAVHAHFGAPTRYVLPAGWKGNTPKHATEARARRTLGDRVARVDLSCGKRLASNVWDAVGIGLWHFKQVTATKTSGPGASDLPSVTTSRSAPRSQERAPRGW